MRLAAAVLALSTLGAANAPAQAVLPKSARDVQGLYLLCSGFQVTQYEFLPGGRLKIGTRFDHPGGQTWSAAWSYADGVVRAAIPYAKDGKRVVAPVLFVPIAWGDRLMLVNAEELFEGDLLGLMNRVGSLVGGTKPRRFGDQATDLRVPTRTTGAGAKLPRLYGSPKAPAPYDELLKSVRVQPGSL